MSRGCFGRVIELLTSSDGLMRAALVNVSNENGPPKVLKCSIVHLVPIEVADIEEQADTMADSPESPHDMESETLSRSDVTTGTTTDLHSSRPRRQAAVLGEAVRRT